MLVGQRLGIEEVDEGFWPVGFVHDDSRYIDVEQETAQPRNNPSGPRLSSMCPGRTHGKSGAGDGIRTHDPNLGKVVLYP